MATGPITQIADVITPEIFNPYVQLLTTQKSALVQSGALVVSPQLNQDLAGGGLVFNAPSFKDLDDDADNIPTDNEFGIDDSVPAKTGAVTEVAVRLSRNKSWSSSDLATAMAGADIQGSIANRVSDYWVRRLQSAYVATMAGIFADNDAAPTGAEHVIGDMTNDVKGASFADGVTNFTTGAFVDAMVTMGDAMGELSLLFVHPIVNARMIKANLIDFVRDADNTVDIPTYLGKRVIVDRHMPSPASGIYHSWIFGAGAVSLGTGAPKVPTETERQAAAGNGGGQEVLHNRVEWIIHPVGNSYVGTAANGGPSNLATVNNLGHADSWQRVYTEREQIKIARLITREF